MKAEELFIGALVRVNREGLSVKKGTIVEIRGIDADIKLVGKGIVGSALCRQMDDERHGIWCEYLEPIPITPEILEKNGFEMTKQEKWLSEWKFQPKNGGRTIFITNINCINGGYDFGCYRDGIFVDFFNIKDVHELQHALRLCGIENEITL